MWCWFKMKSRRESPELGVKTFFLVGEYYGRRLKDSEGEGDCAASNNCNVPVNSRRSVSLLAELQPWWERKAALEDCTALNNHNVSVVRNRAVGGETGQMAAGDAMSG